MLLVEENKKVIDEMVKTDICYIDKSIETVNNLLCKCASKCLKRQNCKQKHKSKPWFNTECRRLKQEMRKLGKLVCKKPNDVQLRATFFTTKRNM